MLAIGQLRHQSATAPSLATHAAVAVAAHQCHESDRRHIHVTCKTNRQLTCREHISVYRYVKIIKIHQDFPWL